MSLLEDLVPHRAQGFRTRVLPVTLIVAALGALIVLGIRLGTWSRCWRGAITEGREGPGLYAIWRLLHGHPLYEHPLGEPYSLTLYNFGFYQAYARLSAWLGVDGERLLLWPRFYTVLGAALGAVLFMRVAARVARPASKLDWVGLGSLAFVVWFGSQFISWWAFAVRPDMWAGTFALLGLELVLTALDSGSLLRLLLASLSFALAWSFKQSTVWTFAGSLLAIVAFRRDLRRAAMLLLPFLLIAGGALVFGGAPYRENLLRAPTIGRLEWSLFSEVMARAIPQNLWVFCFGVGAFAWQCRGGVRAAWQRLAEAERVLASVAFTAFVFGSLACAREGSNKNHLLEGYVACALCAWCAHRRASSDAPPAVMAAGILVALPLAMMPVLQILATLGLPVPRFGRTTFCTVDDARQYASLAETVAALPHPLYADDEVLAQPWHSTSDRYPALVLDGTWYGIARREGLLKPDFPLELWFGRGLGSVVLPQGHPLLKVLEERGARCELLGPAPLDANQVACVLRPLHP